MTDSSEWIVAMEKREACKFVEHANGEVEKLQRRIDRTEAILKFVNGESDFLPLIP